MEGTGLMQRLFLRGEFREECCRNLRAIELSAYSEFMNAMRASGEIDDPKRELIDIIKRWFQIPDLRHEAEIRRVASDERLTLIADSVTNHSTSTAWLEEGYVAPNHNDCPLISPILSNEALVLKVIERRLQMQGVDFKSENEMMNGVDMKEGSETKVKIPQLGNTSIQIEESSIMSADPLLLDNSIGNRVIETQLSFASNMDVDNDSNSESRSKRRRSSSDLDRDISPDITSMSAAENRKRNATQDLRDRLSYTSSPDLERSKQKLEREEIAKEKEAAEAMEKSRLKEDDRDRRLSLTEITQEDQERGKRELSTTSTASCLSTEARDEVRAMMVNKPPPKLTRGRGLSRVRGRSVPPFSGRGRGRGRGKHQISNAIPWPIEIPIQFPPPEPLPPVEVSQNSPNPPKPKLGRGLKVKANGEEVKKRAPYRKKKPTFQPLSSDNNFNETPAGVFKENQNTSQEAPSPPQFRDQLKMGPSFEQQFLHGSTQYYDSFDSDAHPHGQDINPNPNIPRPHPNHQRHQQQEILPKVRHKTKHTVIIHDPHESTATPKNTQNFVDYTESNLKHHPPSIAPPPPPPINSVIVRTPSFTQSPNTPPKIINPHGIVKTHVSITQNQKPMVNFTSSPNRNVYERHNYVSPPPPPYRITQTPSSNNVTHKKRTQNLAAATTYTTQSDPMSYSSPEGGNTSEVVQQQQVSPTTTTTTVGGTTSSVTAGVTLATASSLAVRSRPSPYDFKPPVSSIVTSTATILPALTSVVRMHPLPAQSNPNVPVLHQRKAQPHILATSKIHRNTTGNITVAGVTVSSGVTTTQGIPSAFVTTHSTVIQSVTPGVVQLPSTPTTSVTVPNFNMSSTTNVVSLGKTSIPIGAPTSVSLTRSPGTNIIFVPKNQNPTPGQPGALSSGAVILRRANNVGSNLMILDIHKNNVMGRTPVVSHLLQGARLLNSPQVVNQASLSGAPIRKIIQTSSGKILASSPTTLITSTSTSKSPVRTTRIFTTQSSLGKQAQVNIFSTAFKAPNLHKSVTPIRPLQPNTVRPLTIETKERNFSPDQGKSSTLLQPPRISTIVSSSKNVNKVFVVSNNNSSIDKSNTCDINKSLLSDEVMDNSPPPMEEVEDESYRVRTTNKAQFQLPSYPITTTPSKTIISIVAESDERSNVVSSILNRALQGNRPITTQVEMYMDNEDEFEEDEEDIHSMSITSATSSQSSSLIEEEEEPEPEPEDTQNDEEDESDEDEGEIELIDLADDEPTESDLSTQTVFQPQISEMTEMNLNLDPVLFRDSDDKFIKDNLKPL